MEPQPHPVGAEVGGPEDAPDLRQAQTPAGLLREREAEFVVRPDVPERRPLVIGALAGQLDQLTPDFGGNLSRTPATLEIVERLGRTARGEAVAPLARRVVGDPQTPGDLLVADAIGRKENDPRPKHSPVRGRGASRRALEFSALLARQDDWLGSGAGRHARSDPDRL